jgi:hypothetical protein
MNDGTQLLNITDMNNTIQDLNQQLSLSLSQAIQHLLNNQQTIINQKIGWNTSILQRYDILPKLHPIESCCTWSNAWPKLQNSVVYESLDKERLFVNGNLVESA